MADVNSKSFGTLGILKAMEAYLKTIKLMCLVIVLLGSIPANSAWARGGHGGGHHFGGHHFGGHHFGGHHFGGFGLGLGLGYGLGYGGYWPYYGGYGLGYRGFGGYGLGYGGSYPPAVYIQRQDSAQAATGPQANYWHYCRNPEGYYPHVKKCPDGWLPVAPQPIAQ